MKTLCTCMCQILIGTICYAVPAQIRGIVLDRESNPLPRAAVSIASILPDGDISELQHYDANHDGAFLIDGLEAGNYYLYGPGEGYPFIMISLSETHSSTNVILKPYAVTHMLSVRIKNIPKENGPVQVKLYPGEEGGMNIFNVDGIQPDPKKHIFKYSDLYPGSYEFSFRINDYYGGCTVMFVEESESLVVRDAYVNNDLVRIMMWLDDRKGSSIVWP